jgi:hypothetical protein
VIGFEGMPKNIGWAFLLAPFAPALSIMCACFKQEIMCSCFIEAHPHSFLFLHGCSYLLGISCFANHLLLDLL